VPTASPSIAHGDAISLITPEPRHLGQRIAQRVEANPGGIIRSYREDGRHQAQSNASCMGPAVKGLIGSSVLFLWASPSLQCKS